MTAPITQHIEPAVYRVPSGFTLTQAQHNGLEELIADEWSETIRADAAHILDDVVTDLDVDYGDLIDQPEAQLKLGWAMETIAEECDGYWLTPAEVISDCAERYSVGYRVPISEIKDWLLNDTIEYAAEAVRQEARPVLVKAIREIIDNPSDYG